jgi:hypothetical protein
VGDSPHTTPTRATGAGLGRRQFLRKAAAAGTAVWVVPAIITIDPAAAVGLNSQPPEPPVEPVGTVVPRRDPPPPAATGPTELAFTGANLDHLAAAGLAATAAGAALLLLSAEAERFGPDAASTPRTAHE